MARDFKWSADAEPHVRRRKEILANHPEVRALFGIDKSLKFKAVGLVIFQLISSYYIVKLPWFYALPIAYLVGATVCQAIFLAIHEITHDLAFKKDRHNRWLAIFTNIPIVFPMAMSFKVYHAMHHWEQGKDGVDTDIPTKLEARTFRGVLGKLTWAFHQLLFYAIRPIIVKPVKIDRWQLLNVSIQIIAMTLFIFFIGWKPLAYLLISFFLAGSLHPTAGHFIAEHYVFAADQETYSYYGPLNSLTFNVGYHNEHHDFPYIPGSRLPALKKLAPEAYDNLYSHKSWTMVVLKFIFDPAIDLFSRIKRH